MTGIYTTSVNPSHLIPLIVVHLLLLRCFWHLGMDWTAEQVAAGVTLGYCDTEDLFVEQFISETVSRASQSVCSLPHPSSDVLVLNFV